MRQPNEEMETCKGNGGGLGSGGSSVASERSVGSPALASLLLYFVELMDSVADKEYVMLLVCGRSGTGGRGSGGAEADISEDPSRGQGASGSGGGWITWGRFSLLGQMHSLLPRR